MTYVSGEDSDQLGHPPSLIRVFNVRSIGSWGPNVSSYGQQRLWSDWVDAQADLSLCCAHSSFHWLCQAVAHMSYIRNILLWVLIYFLIWRTVIFSPILELYGIFCQIKCGLRMTTLVSACHVFWHTESSLSAHAILLVLSWGGSIMSLDVLHELDKKLALFCTQLSHLLFSDSIFHQFVFLFSRTPERRSYMEDT